MAVTRAWVASGAPAASIFQAVEDKETPQFIAAPGSTAVGALAGVLITGKGWPRLWESPKFAGACCCRPDILVRSFCCDDPVRPGRTEGEFVEAIQGGNGTPSWKERNVSNQPPNDRERACPGQVSGHRYSGNTGRDAGRFPISRLGKSASQSGDFA